MTILNLSAPPPVTGAGTGDLSVGSTAWRLRERMGHVHPVYDDPPPAFGKSGLEFELSHSLGPDSSSDDFLQLILV